MPWYRVYAEIEMEVEAKDEDSAVFHAETICQKRVVGQEFGHNRNDQGKVTGYTITNIQDDENYQPGPSDCPDCGAVGENRDHVGCGNPQDIPDDSGLDDPMERER